MLVPSFFTKVWIIDTVDSLRFRAHVSGRESIDDSCNLCIFGTNGVGKTRVLKLLQAHCSGDRVAHPENGGAIVATEHEFEGRQIISATHFSDTTFRWQIESSRELLDSLEAPFEKKSSPTDLLATIRDHEALEKQAITKPIPVFLSGGLITQNRTWDETVEELQDLQRDAFHNFLAKEEAQQLTVETARNRFQEISPAPLRTLATFWNEALASSGLSVCTESGGILLLPKQESISFDQIPAAIRTSLLNSATICLESMKHPEVPLLLLLDDPETGLFPDLAEKYLKLLTAVSGTNPHQLILATKSPTLTALFPAARRIRIELEEAIFVSTQGDSVEQSENGSVFDKAPTARKSATPKRPLSRKARYAKLKKAMEETDDQDELANLVDEMMSLQNL